MTRHLPPVLVAGLGRCGSSLVMQMLAAGGMTCVGRPPAFEEHPMEPLPQAWIDAACGKAAKLLNPHIARPPAGARLVSIWLDRNPREQARSMMKFAHLVGGLPKADRAHIKRVERSLPGEGRTARSVLALHGPVLRLSYEGILSGPGIAARTLRTYLQQWHPRLDVEVMARAVRKHDPACAPGVDMEIQLLGEAGLL